MYVPDLLYLIEFSFNTYPKQTISPTLKFTLHPPNISHLLLSKITIFFLVPYPTQGHHASQIQYPQNLQEIRRKKNDYGLTKILKGTHYMYEIIPKSRE
jgi:hypothetical protein